MGRLGPSVLILLALAIPATAIEDPADDVFRDLSTFEGVDAPYLDILNVTYRLEGTTLHMTMELAGPVREAPPDAEVNYIFVVDLEGRPDAPVYGQEDITVVCKHNTTKGSFRCFDTADEAHLVTAAGYTDRNVTTTIQILDERKEIALAGGANLLEAGRVTALDATDNLLPYSSRPPTDGEPERVMDTEPEGRSPWIPILVIAGLVAVVGIWRVRRPRA